MGEHENLSRDEAIAKISQIADGEIAMVHTFGSRQLSVARPMATAGVDPDGSLWFLSPAGSWKNQQLGKDDLMQVTYSLKASSEYLVLDGTAVALRDREKLDELWNAIDKNWFPAGKDDPTITLIHFTPSVGHYWQTKHGKPVQLLAMVAGAVTGKPVSDGVEGDLRP